MKTPNLPINTKTVKKLVLSRHVPTTGSVILWNTPKKLPALQKSTLILAVPICGLMKFPQSQVDKTCEYVKKQGIKNFYICHDTDLHCKLALWNTTPSKEAGVGLVVECE